LMTARYENLVNFLKLHYCLSRRDEPFWRTNTDLQSVPPALQELLERWRWRAPSRFDFALDSETFAFFSYQYILYGMGFETRLPGPHAARMTDPFAKVRAYGEQALRDLPLHRDLIDRINAA